MPDSQLVKNSPPGRFLSLKWKIMLLLSLVLVAGNGVLSWLAHRNQMERFNEQRAEMRSRHLMEALAIQQDSTLHTRQLADMLSSYAGMGQYFAAKANQAKLGAVFDAYWASLQFNFGVDALRVYDEKQQLKSEWSSGQPRGARELTQVAAVLKREQSLAWIDCAHECAQYAAAPVLWRGHAAGVVVVAAQMADMIISFNRLTGVDMGILFPSAESGRGRYLPGLAMRVSGLSDSEQNLPLLQALHTLPPEVGGRRWVGMQWEGRNFELVFAKAPGGIDGGKMAPMLVVIEDVTDEYARIRSQALWRFGGDVIASLLVLLVLTYILNRVIGRMTRAAEAIPLLGQGEFAEVRGRVRPSHHPFLQDEVDSLDRAAVALSYRLEQLEEDAQNYAAQMRDMLHSISVERDFNENLLDTAQVIILTQSAAGEILTVNRYCEQLCGWREEDLQGRRFTEMLCLLGSSETDMPQLLREVAVGELGHLSRECVMVGRDGFERTIAWNHSQLVSGADRTAQVLSVGVDITERKRAEARIAYLAEHDPLTGLFNRQHFQAELEQALSLARRSGRSGALLYLDLDGFKYVNDISGHQAGDALLRMVADELVHVTRDIDLLGRLGGDELGVLLHESDLNGAVQVAEKINRRLEQIKFPGLGASHRVSASIGIVMFPSEDMDVKQMLANADIAMYQAKAYGRSRWHLYAAGERMQEKMHRWVHWEERIKQALEDGLFVMLYQPILEVQSNRVSHYEALLRMRGDDGELIAPVEFIEIAEKSGLIREIDRHVVQLVIERLRKELDAGRAIKVAINLSGVSVNDAGLLDFLEQQLARDSLLAKHLMFEITETAAVADFTAARAFMEAVRNLGCLFSLDDFGVGFSSFYYLKQLPVDFVKIDGSFIRHLADNADDQVFVRALVEVARGFGKKTVAEFVEDERSLALLREFGVDCAQGYLIGMPSEELLPEQ